MLIVFFYINKLLYIEHKHNVVIKEVKVLRKLHHKAIIRMKNAFIDNNNLVIVMECASGGELKEYLHRKEKLEETEARNIFKQIADGINHCHNLNVIHRDLKLENVLFATKGCQHIKVSLKYTLNRL